MDNPFIFLDEIEPSEDCLTASEMWEDMVQIEAGRARMMNIRVGNAKKIVRRVKKFIPGARGSKVAVTLTCLIAGVLFCLSFFLSY
jgi:hypothetical protein